MPQSSACTSGVDRLNIAGEGSPVSNYRINWASEALLRYPGYKYKLVYDITMACQSNELSKKEQWFRTLCFQLSKTMMRCFSFALIHLYYAHTKKHNASTKRCSYKFSHKVIFINKFFTQ